MSTPAIRWTLVGCWMTANIIMSHQPHVPGPSVPHMDKVLHLLSYGLFAFLLARAWWPRLSHRMELERVALLLSACLLWGVGDEIHQSFIPGRSADPFDVLADAAGALMVILILRPAKMKP